MTADAVAPIHVGITELDPDSADKSQPNTFQVTFQGGGAGTELTQLEIDGSKAGGAAVGGRRDLQHRRRRNRQRPAAAVHRHRRIRDFRSPACRCKTTRRCWSSTCRASRPATRSRFRSGPKPCTSIDPVTSAVSLNAVVTGAAFAGSQFNATFVATGYSSAEASGDFVDAYDASFAAANQSSGTTLDLPDDAYSTTQNLSTYSAGAVAVVTQPPLPRDLKGGRVQRPESRQPAGVGGARAWPASRSACGRWSATPTSTREDGHDRLRRQLRLSQPVARHVPGGDEHPDRLRQHRLDRRHDRRQHRRHRRRPPTSSAASCCKTAAAIATA